VFTANGLLNAYCSELSVQSVRFRCLVFVFLPIGLLCGNDALVSHVHVDVVKGTCDLLTWNQQRKLDWHMHVLLYH
jgi:hypothetical protein